MAKRTYPKSEDDRRQNNEGPAYVSWASENDRESAFQTYSKALEEASFNIVETSKANYRRSFDGVTTHTDGRPGLLGADFDWFRPGQAAPTRPKDIMAFGRYAYRRVGLIHNAIDLMGDFSCQGIRLVHPNPQIQRFYTDWFKKVSGKHVSERLGNLLFREANVPVRFYMAKVNKSKRLEMQKTVGREDVSVDVDDIKITKNEIPWRYTFVDPLLVEPLGGPLANLAKHKVLTLKVPYNLKMHLQKIQQSKDPEVRKVLEHISPDILKAVESNSEIILPPDKTRLYHYKKDDWQTWADPITYSAFESLNLYQRLQLADKAALDGAISKIRVWKLGSLEHKLAPAPNASSTLADMLGANVGGGTIDIIWGPDIELIETASDVEKFLGEEKYKPTLMAIYATLGIPPTLTGTFGASGTTNNFISLKTLTERLNYVRDIIIDFWTEQIRLVQLAMGFRFPAQIEFDYMYLDDPAAMATLLLNMADRNIVSEEFVQHHIKAKPEMEVRRVDKEQKRRDKRDQEKISPYHSVDKEHDLKKLALQTGVSSPTELGVKLEEKKKGDKSLMDLKERQLQKQAQMKNTSVPPSNKTGTPGRPKNSKDSGPRKQKQFKPKSKAALETWARQAFDKVSDIVNPIILENFGKSSLRSLTSEEFNQLEQLKFEVLCNLSIEQEITKVAIAEASQKPLKHIHNEFAEWVEETEATIGNKLTIDQIRDLRALYYVYHNFNGNF